MTGRLIDADALCKAIHEEWDEVCVWDEDGKTTEYKFEDLVDEQPTIDPVRHGKWIKLDMHAHLADHKCTACGQECYVPTCMGEPMYTYCPNCGAKMDERKE